MWITQVSIKNPVFATMMMVALLVLGLFSYNRLAIDQMPEVDIPIAVVWVAYPGASPEAIETDLSKKIEDALNPVNGVRHIRSRSREGSSLVIVEFDLKTDINVAMQEVRDKVSQIRPSFPRDAKDPYISKANSDDDQAVVSIALSSEQRSLRELTTLADQLARKRMENVRGVGTVTMSGGVKREVQVQLRPEAMRALGVGVDQVIAALRTENQDMPAGSVSLGREEQLVRVEGRIASPEDFGRIIVARRNAVPIYLDQLASVVDGKAEETSIARVDGRRAISLEMVKIRGSNTVEVGKGILEAVDELKKELPPDVTLQVLSNNARFIKSAVDNVQHTIIEGALLTVLIVFLFLHSWRSTVITGLTLPIAVIATFTALFAFGFTLNFLTLMALSLCIGLLIDDAIVVRENIVRHLAMGKDHYTAAREGTQEIGLAVMATTFAIVAVFLPVAFMGGIIGRFFYQFGITVTVAVLVSLFVSFTLDPMLSSIWADPPESRFKRLPWLSRLMDGFESGVVWAHASYGSILGWALEHRGKVMLIAVLSFLGSFLLVPLIGSEFIPESDESELTLRLTTPVGSSLSYTESKTAQVEEALREFPEVRLLYSRVGTNNGKNTAFINVQLKPRDARTRSQKELEQEFRQRVRPIAGVELAVGWNKPVQVALLGPDSSELARLAKTVEQQMLQVKGITDVESSEKAANPTLAIRVNRDLASDLGLSVGQVAAAARPLIAGDAVGMWLAPDGQNYEVTVRLGERDRRGIADLGDLPLVAVAGGGAGGPRVVPLRQVAELVATSSPKSIERLDLQRMVTVSANVEGRPAGDAGNEVTALTKKMELPPGYRFHVGGSTKEMQESFGYAMMALGMAVIFIYLILASQFGSFLQPLAIMASLPLSLIGVFLALLVTGSTLNIFSIIGFIMLMGLVTKNAILLVDFTNQGRREGLGLKEAIAAAGQVRLRPILMTTAAMIFGMLPLALGLGEGGEGNATMGRAIIGGVITSTLLTLVVVPVIYCYIDRWTRSSRVQPTAGGARAPAVVPSDKLV
ncbi:MAG: efflux RND transporter permease subunit [Betaproteobacteria bacterium]|nr:efflux RND transporter permease subunit [Betaproteobacteria bacterium]